jgi:hypothetical protein
VAVTSLRSRNRKAGCRYQPDRVSYPCAGRQAAFGGFGFCPDFIPGTPLVDLPATLPQLPSINTVDVLARVLQPELKAPEPPPLSIAAQIDEILQEMLQSSPLASRLIRLIELPSKGVAVMVGLDRYESVEAVPDEDIRQMIRRCSRVERRVRARKKKNCEEGWLRGCEAPAQARFSQFKRWRAEENCILSSACQSLLLFAAEKQPARQPGYVPAEFQGRIPAFHRTNGIHRSK